MAFSKLSIKTPMFSTSLSMFMKMALSIHQVPTKIICIAALVQALESKGPQYLFRRSLSCNRNINIPWATQGMGDADYLYAFQQVVMPVAYDFNPDLVISKSSVSNKTSKAERRQLLLDLMLPLVTNLVVALLLQRAMHIWLICLALWLAANLLYVSR